MWVSNKATQFQIKNCFSNSKSFFPVQQPILCMLLMCDCYETLVDLHENKSFECYTVSHEAVRGLGAIYNTVNTASTLENSFRVLYIQYTPIFKWSS